MCTVLRWGGRGPGHGPSPARSPVPTATRHRAACSGTLAPQALPGSRVAGNADSLAASSPLRLQQQPLNDTVITLESVHPRTVSVSERELVFTPEDWDQPQYVNITTSACARVWGCWVFGLGGMASLAMGHRGSGSPAPCGWIASLHASRSQPCSEQKPGVPLLVPPPPRPQPRSSCAGAGRGSLAFGCAGWPTTRSCAGCTGARPSRACATPRRLGRRGQPRLVRRRGPAPGAR